MSYFPSWPRASTPAVMPDERLSWGATIPMGIQHLVAMSGSTILGPLLMGFDPNLAILFSGIGTLIFFVLTAGRVPSYLGSSFSFIAVVIAVTGYAGTGVNTNIGPALGGIIAAGALYVLIGLVVTATGTGWIEKLMPPAVTGAIGAAIGLNLAPVAVQGSQGTGPHVFVAMLTLLAVAVVSTYAPTVLRRISILIGIAVGYVAVLILGNGMGLLPPIDFGALAVAPWFGMPTFHSPEFNLTAMSLIAPVAIILVAENLGHIKAISAMTGENMDRYIGRGFIGDGIATMVSGSGGGTGVTTYVENMGVMAVTRVFSTLVFVVAALVAILLGFSPKFGALLHTIPAPVLGGLAVAVFGLIAAAMIRLFVDNHVDFSEPRNLFTVGITLVFGSGSFTLSFGSFVLGGIGTATFAALIVYQLLSIGRDKA
ncbi:solute carrier family 23 protein [Paenirhodobacter populi]|uniref:Pyrimidine utilization transport protein G n=1 Tax=Paenirhodobacter populi TaxID=2306993 RepID=A0A443K0R3_9RHOB|nr:solute carrier family 23 protein [Sinirhodobacter populi]RWR09583.1 pyrimidine utilization transport protein G [Sinirhodobacter populi]RWR10337.1 pyrimidine utilization transport protein G [Sinirhodobacter populi]RWR20432.1 pyrimidine utilization transport protein G [Sinirhodobacter populi]RWR26390.1 pyrimidine utilization transport protein G [Sinirhodobacter populi]